MRIIRLITAILLALLVLSALSGCSTSYGGNRPGYESYGSVSSNASSKPTPQETPVGKYTVGTKTAVSFKSKYLGFGYNLPSGYYMVDYSEVDELIKLGANDADITYEMAAKNNAGDNVIIYTEKLPDLDCTADGYRSMLLSRVKKEYPGMFGGFFNTTGVTYGGKSFCYTEALQINEIIPGYDMTYHQLFFYYRKYGNRMCVIAMTCADYVSRETILSGIVAL